MDGWVLKLPFLHAILSCNLKNAINTKNLSYYLLFVPSSYDYRLCAHKDVVVTTGTVVAFYTISNYKKARKKP